MNKRKRSGAGDNAASRSLRTNDLLRNNLRNRIYNLFGSAVLKKDGGLPSPVRYLASLLLRTCGVLKWGPDETREQRVRTVTVGLETVLRDTPMEGVGANEMSQRFTEVSNHASKVRVNASLLANYIMISELYQSEQLPVADSPFFKACLSCCRGAYTGNREVTEMFQTFSAETGIQAYQPLPGTTRVFENQADDMANAANTFLDLHFEDRRTTLLKWALKRTLRPAVAFSRRVLEARVGELCAFILIAPDIQAVEDRLQHLEFFNCSDLVKPLCETVLDYDDSDQTRLRHLLMLQEELLTEDRMQYEAVCKEAHRLYPKLSPEDNNKDSRKQYIQQHWAFYEAPPSIMSPLPQCHNSATFIRLCKNSVCELFPKLRVFLEDGDPWWYQCIMNPFSKEAAITCLRSPLNKYARSEHGMIAAMKMMKAGKSVAVPWMVGPSFETDGKQIKLNLITLEKEHPGAPGLTKLHKKGYQVSFEDSTLDEVLQQGDGVYSLRHIHTSEGLQAFDDVQVTPIDPGQVCVVEGARIAGQAWRLENAHNVMFGEHERITFLGTDWQNKTFTAKSKSAELYRRREGSPYGRALSSLREKRKKTCDKDIFTEYCKVWSTVCNDVWTELLTYQRRGHHFLRFRATQRTLEEIGEKIAPIKGGKEKYGRRIVLFEDGMWKSKKGCASAPIKKVVRVVCQRAATVMVPAAYSTMTCLGCGRVTEEGATYRTRLCTTSPGCLLHPNTPTLEYDRDLGARGVIGMRGVYCIAGIWNASQSWRPVGYTV